MSLRVLGIETSCDETAVAVVRDGRVIESNVISSQTDLHERFGGVVPEQAARAHLRAIVPALEEARALATVDWDDLDAIAVTHGPGLAGALLVGVNTAKALAFAWRKPLIGVNHLEGHLYANWLETGEAEPELEFPIVALIVSGGHTDLVLATGHGHYRRLGRTRDDAAGEAFDKVARMLGLPFPGGPPIERAAADGDPERFAFPRAWLEPDGWDFSFSGLKTAVLHEVRRLPELPVADLAASFQRAVVDVLATKTVRAAHAFGARQIALGGGVAANLALRRRIESLSDLPVRCPRPGLCTDNGAMIAVAGYYGYLAGQRAALTLDVDPGLAIGQGAGSGQQAAG
jgi:N6-L-threonylcarbamoyladenine synthase